MLECPPFCERDIQSTTTIETNVEFNLHHAYTILKINIYCSCSILQWMRNKISLGHKLQEIKKARPRKKAQKQTMNFDLDRT